MQKRRQAAAAAAAAAAEKRTMLGFSTLVAVVAAAVGLLYVKDLRLPYPCFQVVQTIPSEQIGAPSDLRGPYAINLHLQKAKKLFEHQLSGVGAPRSTDVHVQCQVDGFKHAHTA